MIILWEHLCKLYEDDQQNEILFNRYLGESHFNLTSGSTIRNNSADQVLHHEMMPIAEVCHCKQNKIEKSVI